MHMHFSEFSHVMCRLQRRCGFSACLSDYVVFVRQAVRGLEEEEGKEKTSLNPYPIPSECNVTIHYCIMAME